MLNLQVIHYFNRSATDKALQKFTCADNNIHIKLKNYDKPQRICGTLNKLAFLMSYAYESFELSLNYSLDDFEEKLDNTFIAWANYFFDGLHDKLDYSSIKLLKHNKSNKQRAKLKNDLSKFAEIKKLENSTFISEYTDLSFIKFAELFSKNSDIGETICNLILDDSVDFLITKQNTNLKKNFNTTKKYVNKATRVREKQKKSEIPTCNFVNLWDLK